VLRRLTLALVLLLTLAPAAHAANYLRLGFDDDRLKWMVRPNADIAMQRQLGAVFTRITIPWQRGEVRQPPVVRTYIARAARAGQLHQKIVIAVYADASQAPVNAVWRDQYCRYVRGVVAHLPYMSAVVIWNEANSPRYWPESSGPAGYEALLARCYDVLHALRPNVNVVDSTASHYDPAGFIAGVGQAYRDSGRDRPIVDTFGHNPYPDFAAEDPWVTHPATGTIGEGDYATLMAALTQAFQFTAQRVPSATWARLWYLEDGFQTSIPWWLDGFYTGRENDPTVLPATGFLKSQASQLTAAISLAYCQPAVSAFFNFELIDERRLIGWQSGLLYSDGFLKPSFYAYQQVAADVYARTIDCSKVTGAPAPTPPSG
jgi:hypothetical protein